MDFGSLDQAGFLRLLKRLQGKGGYSEDDDSNRVKELNAVAKVAELASAAIGLVGQNQFVSQAIEALLTYEALYNLPSDYGFTNAQRQSRLKAFASSLPKMVEARLDAAFDAYLGATSGVTIRPEADVAWTGHAAPGAAGLYVQRQEPSADTAERRTLDPILARGLPARALGGKVSTGNATFGSGSIDRKSINLTQAVTPATQTKSHCEPYPHYPGSVIEATTWKEIQAMLMWKGKNVVLSTANQGQTIVAVGSIPAGNVAVVDGPTFGGGGAITWDNRLVQAWGYWSSTNITAAGTDLTGLPATDACWLSASKLGTIAVPYAPGLVDIATGAAVGATVSINGAGDLIITNTGGATKYLVLMIRCTPAHTTGTFADTQPWVSTTDITNAAITQVAKGAEIRDANGGGAAWTKTSLFSSDKGAIRRICYSGPIGVGPLDAFAVRDEEPKRVILDSSEDWRGRYVLIVPILQTSNVNMPAAAFDGVLGRALPSADAPARLFWTGTGAAQGSATALAFQHPDKIVAAKNCWIFADSTTGDLIAEWKATASTNHYGALMFLAIGSMPRDGSGVSTSVPLHATQIHALDLNQIQNNGCFAQGFQGGVPRAYIGASTKRTIPTCPPLGLIAEGAMPRRPVSWMVRERVGDYNEVANGYYESRQRIYGQRKRVLSIRVPASTTIEIDDFNIQSDSIDQLDPRDRLVWIEGRYSATDITVFHSPQITDVGASRVAIAFYFGPFADQSIPIGPLTFRFSFARQLGLHSRILVQETAGADVYLNLVMEYSGHLGLTDRRLYGASP